MNPHESRRIVPLPWRMHEATMTNAAPLTASERSALSARIRAEGLAGFSRRSGASVPAIARSLAGLDTRRGTLTLLRLALASPSDAA